MILPGTVRITRIAPATTTPDGQPRWRITLRGVLQARDLAPVVDPEMGDLECALSFTTADPSLLTQIRSARLRYVLDLLQLERQGGEHGRVEDS